MKTEMRKAPHRECEPASVRASLLGMGFARWDHPTLRRVVFSIGSVAALAACLGESLDGGPDGQPVDGDAGAAIDADTMLDATVDAAMDSSMDASWMDSTIDPDSTVDVLMTDS